MMQFFRFFRIQILKIRPHIFNILSVSLISFFTIAFLAFLFVRNMDFSGTKQKISVGIVGDLSNKYMKFGVDALEMMDSSRFFVDLQILNLEEAEKLLRKHTIAAYVVIPDGFFESVENGSNDKKVTYVTSSGASGIESLLKDQVSSIITNLLLQAQAGIFAMEHIAALTNQRPLAQKYLLNLNMKYVKWTLDRTKLARVQEAGLSHGLSVFSYYLCALLILFFSLSGISSYPVFMNRIQSQYKFFASRGIGCFKQVFCECEAYFLLHLCQLFWVMLSIFVLCSVSGIEISSWRYCGIFKGTVSLFFHMIPVCFLLSLLQFMLFEFSDNTVSLISLQFLVFISLCFTGGCFYPLDFFPEQMKILGNILPAGISLSFLTSSLMQNDSISSLLIISAYSFLFFCISVFLRFRRIRGRS
ncbi:ABC transporter permease [Treponema sp.]|uniref:ABC transporter permease n=1 Tax=Treponema sp. TaxID=166 RepID=UPI00388E5B5D